MKAPAALYLCSYPCLFLVTAILLQGPRPLTKEGVLSAETASTAVARASTWNALAAIPKAAQPQAPEGYGKLPLSFEANQGQSDPRVKFLSRGSGYTLFLTCTEAVLVLRRSTEAERTQFRQPRLPESSASHPNGETQRVKVVEKSRATQGVLRMQLVGANPAAPSWGLEQLPGKSNYFLGNDPKKWRTNVPTYAKVKYQGIYPGVDLVYYGNQRELEYDFAVAPGADPRVIALEFHGAEKVRVDRQGDLVLQAAGSHLHLHKPTIYQEVNGARRLVSGNYALRDNGQVGFDVATYDLSKPLVVDPVLVYSTYLGGSSVDEGFGIAVDSAGNAYVTGVTYSANFPTTAGAFQTTFAGGTCGTPPNTFPCSDAFVAKLNSEGSQLVYSTYLGGNGVDEGFGIAVDPSGNAYVTGSTSSTDFPTAAPIQATLGGGSDAFVTKLNAAGSALVYSTYLGGSSSDFGGGIAVDPSGNAYVTGSTSSTNFPTANPFRGTFGGGPSDAFAAKLSAAGSTLLYSTYLGGFARDAGRGIAVDSLGNAYLTGAADSGNFPTANPFQRICGGCQQAGPDAFVAKIDPTQSGSDSLLYSSFLGGNRYDEAFGIAVDASGNAYVTGIAGSGFPITPGAFQTSFGGQFEDAFVAKVSPGVAPGFTLTSASVAFGNQAVGTNSLPQAVILGDAGTATLTITSIVITGTNSAEFAQTNTCGTSVGGGANCAINVTFTPTTSGSKTAAITITDNAAGNPHTLNLTGTGVPFSLSPSSLSFGNQLVGTTSAPRAVTLTNVSSATLTIMNITITGTNSGEFMQSNNCPISPSTLAAGASCTISVTFTPAATGNRSATIAITDSVGSLYTVPLSGNGTADFTTSASPSTATITAGQSTSYTLTITPVGGFTGTVFLSCSGAPSAASCSLPPSVTLSGTTAATATATITTTARSIMTPGPGPQIVSPHIGLRAGWQWLLVLLALAMLGRLAVGRLDQRRVCVSFGVAVLVMMIILTASGCGGGTRSTGGGGGTPTGNYTLTFTGTSGGLAHNTSVTLTIN